MKNRLTLIFLTLVFSILQTSFTLSDKKVFLEDFSIGKFSYSMYTKKMYLHDDDVNAVFFVVYQKGYKASYCSALKTAEHKGKIITTGSYHYTTKYLEFKEYHFDRDTLEADSTIKKIYPNKRGELYVRDYIEYKNGVGKKESK